MIDTNTSKKSIIGYGQYFTYRNIINNNMDINITQTGAVNVQFNISLTILIRLVVVKTLISLVDFYIIKVDTPFLLYFVDMDRLQVYYNNVINTLIGPVTTLGSKYITLPII
jgi:hypothetical protein